MSRKRGPPAPLPTTEIVAMVRAVVCGALPEKMGPYAVAYPTEESATRVLTTRTAITFSLSAVVPRASVCGVQPFGSH